MQYIKLEHIINVKVQTYAKAPKVKFLLKKQK